MMNCCSTQKQNVLNMILEDHKSLYVMKSGIFKVDKLIRLFFWKDLFCKIPKQIIYNLSPLKVMLK